MEIVRCGWPKSELALRYPDEEWGVPVHDDRKHFEFLVLETMASDRLSADLRKRGFKFVGSTVIFAHMQAAGLVNDHVTACLRHRELRG